MLFEVRELHAAYGRLEVLHGVSLAVAEGEIVTLVGCNGAGKSTTLCAVSGLVRILSGTVRFDGRELAGAEPHQVVEAGIVHVPEGRRIFPRLTVAENLTMGAYVVRGGSRREDLDRVYQLFPILAERRGQAGGTLSGGEQQMLAIARGLMARPRLLMLDEPSLGVAPLLVEKIFAALVDWNRETRVPILLVEQNAQLALELAHRAYVLETGRVVLEGTGRELLVNEDVKRAYLGL